MRSITTSFSVLLTCLLVSQNCFSAAESTLGSNGLQKLNSDHYEVNAADPFLILPLTQLSGSARTSSIEISNDDSSSAHQVALKVGMSLITPSADLQEIPFEIFFKPLNDGSSESATDLRFDPNYRVKFKVKNQSFDKLLLPLPGNIMMASDYIRLDLDQCRRCQIQITGVPSISEFQADKSEGILAQVSELEIMNGTQTIEDSGLNLPLHDWVLNDIQASSTGLRVSGKDPYVVSPRIDAATAELGGILFTLSVPAASGPVFDFQLFYSTDTHHFRESASTLVRLATNHSGTKSGDTPQSLEFFIPLNFLSSSIPQSRVLKRIRLDLANPTQSFADTGGDNIWQIREVQLVNKSKARQYSNLIPNQLLHRKAQSNGTRQTIVGIAKKILNDLGFTVAYCLLLLIVIITMVRKYRTA